VAVEIVRALPDSQWDRSVVLRWPGPLQADFEGTGAKVVLEPLRRLRAALRLWPLTRPLANWLEQLVAFAVIACLRPDVIWCNTVLSACYVRPAVRLRRGVLLHSLEPAGRMADVLGRYRLTRYWPATVLVGCAPLVCADMAAVTGRPVDAVLNLPYVPDQKKVLALASRDVPELPDHGFLVGACGTADSRKGVDLWLELVAHVAPSVASLDPHFVWIGADAPSEFADWASRTSLGDRVTFTGSLENPYPWLAALDVFTFTSREDQYPLVVLEAMALGRPVVGFAVGDVPAQVGQAGRLVPPLATREAADAVIELLEHPAERSLLGEAAEERVRHHFSLESFTGAIQRHTLDAIPDRRRPRETPTNRAGHHAQRR
jgi:glycosyltransferase involved in cell wall biosynthesis